MLIGDIRVMFDWQGQWLKIGEKQTTTVKDILKYFPHIVSRNQVVCYMMLIIEWSGF